MRGTSSARGIWIRPIMTQATKSSSTIFSPTGSKSVHPGHQTSQRTHHRDSHPMRLLVFRALPCHTQLHGQTVLPLSCMTVSQVGQMSEPHRAPYHWATARWCFVHAAALVKGCVSGSNCLAVMPCMIAYPFGSPQLR